MGFQVCGVIHEYWAHLPLLVTVLLNRFMCFETPTPIKEAKLAACRGLTPAGS